MLFAVVVYMGVVASWKVLRMGSVAPLLSQWMFLVGIPVGALFVWIDVVVEAYLQPGSQTARLFKRMIRGDGGAFDRVRRTIVLVRSLATRDTHLCSQNILFAGLWIVMALFGLTSTSSTFGKGVVLGIGLQLAVRLLGSLRQLNQALGVRLFEPEGSAEPERPEDSAPRGTRRSPRGLSPEGDQSPFHWFFWPVHQSFSAQQERLVAGGFLTVFVLLTLLV